MADKGPLTERVEYEVRGKLPDDVKRDALRFAFYASLVGYGIGTLSILLGMVLFIMGITGNLSWTIELTEAKSALNDAAPGALFFVGGVVIIAIVHFRVKVKEGGQP